VLAGTPGRSMERPDGIVDRLVDKQTGRSARPGQANTMFELFMEENAPTESNSRQPRTNNENTRNSDDIPSIEILF